MKILNFLTFLLIFTMVYGKFPQFIKLCKRDSKINDCIRQNIEISKQYMKKGIPRLFVPPTNPFKVIEVSITTPIVTGKLYNFNAYGLENFTLEQVNFDLEKNKFQIKLDFTHIEATTRYKFDGKLVGIEVHGEGPVRGNISNLGLDLTMSGNRFGKNGKTYIKFSEKSLKVTFSGVAYVFFENLFENEETTKAANAIINQNTKELVSELEPLIEDTYGLIISESIQKLFNKFSIDELFPM